MSNQIKTTILLAILTIFLIWIGQVIGGRQGMIIALILAAGMNFFSYWFSDKIILRMYGAHEITSNQAPELYALVQTLARSAGLPMPKIFILPQDAPNAFATGRNPDHAVVAVTQGLLNVMERDELAGVLSHELAHVKNRDILIGSIAATLSGAVMVLASMARWTAIFGGGRGDDDEGGSGIIGLIIMSIIAPLAAVLIQMAISRSREYIADADGAKIAGNNTGLASALEKLGAYSKRLPMDANPSTAHIFTVSPLSGSGLMGLFSTHPPIEERVSRLRGVHPTKGPADSGRSRQLEQGKDFWDRLNK